jgi:hypothetical protein
MAATEWEAIRMSKPFASDMEAEAIRVDPPGGAGT